MGEISRRVGAALLRTAAIAGTAVVALTLTASAAGAEGQGQGITITPAAAAPNSTYTAVATGFAPDSPVEVRVTALAPAPRLVTSDLEGNATATFASDRFPGIYEITFLGRDADLNVRIVKGAYSNLETDCVELPCKQVSTLPRTGASSTEPLLVAGLVLLGVGAIAAGRSQALRGAGAAVVLLAAGAAIVDVPTAAAQASGTGTITGTVTQQGTGDPLADVCVQAVSGTTYSETVTGNDGTYTFHDVPAGATARVGFVDCVPTRFHQTTSTAASVVADQTATASIALVPRAAIGGIVAAGLDDHPAPGCVGIGPDTDSITPCGALVGAAGAYLTTVNLPEVVLLFDPDNPLLAGEYFGNATVPGATAAIPLTAGELTIADAFLVGGGTFSGTVTDADTGDAPLRAVCAASYLNDAVNFASAHVSSDDGSYTIENVPAGTHKLRFFDCEGGEGDPYVEQWWDAHPDQATADGVPLNDGEGLQNMDASLSTSGIPTTSSTNPPSTTSSSTSTSLPGTSSTTSSTSTSTSLPVSTSSSTSTSTSAPVSTSSSTSSTTPTSSSVPTSSSSTSVTSSTVPGSTSSSSSTTSTTAGGGSTTSTTISPTPLPSDGPAASSAASAAPGGSLTLTGTGFGPGTTVTGVAYSDPVVLGRATATSTGTVSLRVTIPSTLPAGTHTLQLQGVDPSGDRRVLSATVQVTSSATTARGTPTGGLPRTGQQTRDLLLIAGALLGAGLLVEGTRQRRGNLPS